jgi:hypothetical protein
VKKVGKFFAAMFSERGSALSGPASVPLAIAALYVSGTLLKLIYGTLAVLLGFISAYSIWLREYERAEREVALNTRPEIKVEVRYCFWAYPAVYNSGPTQAFVWLRLTNIRDVDTIIKTCRLIVTTDNETIDGPNDPAFHTGVLTYEPAVTIPSSTPYGIRDRLEMISLSWLVVPIAPLVKGIHRDGWLAFNINLHHLNHWQSLHASVTLEVTDSFDGKHQSAPTDLVIRYAEFNLQ